MLLDDEVVLVVLLPKIDSVPAAETEVGLKIVDWFDPLEAKEKFKF